MGNWRGYLDWMIGGLILTGILEFLSRMDDRSAYHVNVLSWSIKMEGNKYSIQYNSFACQLPDFNKLDT